MPKNIDDVIRALSPARRKKVETRAAQVLAEELTLRQLRTAQQKTQVSVAAELGIAQESVSRIEQRSDLLLSTLRGYVEAMGGDLELIATFPNRPPVVLKGLAAIEPGSTKRIRSSTAGRRSRTPTGRSKRQAKDAQV